MTSPYSRWRLLGIADGYDANIGRGQEGEHFANPFGAGADVSEVDDIAGGYVILSAQHVSR